MEAWHFFEPEDSDREFFMYHESKEKFNIRQRKINTN